MKRLSLFLLIIAFVLSASAVYAEQKAPLGIHNLVVKLDYINFTDDTADNLDVDEGFYIGIEDYGEMIVPNLYLGAEVGYTNPDGEATVFIPFLGIFVVDTELIYVPIELNLKYAIEHIPNFVFNFGAGVSYNYVRGEIGGFDEGDWVFGGQFFADLTYKFYQFFIGGNGKYQITEETDFGIGGDVNMNNWRIGGHIGIMF